MFESKCLGDFLLLIFIYPDSYLVSDQGCTNIKLVRLTPDLAARCGFQILIFTDCHVFIIIALFLLHFFFAPLLYFWA